jgi:antibiotic biosynthesis monooxygenase (ABM) superfamily enzyme
MNMIVLLMLYPVFVWGVSVGTPMLTKAIHLDFPIALFIGNAFSVILTSYLVPWTASRLDWWLNPPQDRRLVMNLQGRGLVVLCYAAMIMVFWKVMS